ncbi:MAG: hypothetical protein J6W24_06100 [Prevotella sp.]|nr:hypothetical protein [Prevotella sp.]
MAQEVTNYNRFWMLLHEARALLVEDKEEVKREMVFNATHGRTDSLKELTQEEYDGLCEALERGMKRPYRPYNPMKKARSGVLHRMQLLGVNTADWNAVDRFCLNKRIAGKRFCRLSEEELQAVYVKCLMIRKKRDGENENKCRIIKQSEYGKTEV